MLPIYQNRYGERENCKGSKYSVSACMRLLHGAFQLLSYIHNDILFYFEI